jgi:hypothetical protein
MTFPLLITTGRQSQLHEVAAPVTDIDGELTETVNHTLARAGGLPYRISPRRR